VLRRTMEEKGTGVHGREKRTIELIYRRGG
jgi:hypothetical protein